MLDFKLDFLDHVGIQVKNLDKSIKWYRDILGLEEHRFPKWGDYPVFMLQNRMGVALFSASENATEREDLEQGRIEIDHFAFRVSKESYTLAIQHFKRMDVEFQEKDHYYFQSVYVQDPDKHTIELTAINIDETEFYQKQS